MIILLYGFRLDARHFQGERGGYACGRRAGRHHHRARRVGYA